MKKHIDLKYWSQKQKPKIMTGRARALAMPSSSSGKPYFPLLPLPLSAVELWLSKQISTLLAKLSVSFKIPSLKLTTQVS